MQHTRKDDLKSDFYHDVGEEVESFIGHWRNTLATTRQIAEVNITSEDGVIRMQAWGAGESENIDWGTVDCTIYSSNVNSRMVEGLTTDFDFGFMKTRIACNLKYGILVIQTYNEFLDDSGRSNYFSREFFFQTEPDESPGPRDTKDDSAIQPIDYARYLGSWANSYQHSKGIERFDLFEENGDLRIRLTGKEKGLVPGEWGSESFRPYAYGPKLSKAMAFTTHFDLPTAEVVLAVNENKGLLVIAAFFHFKTAGQGNDCFIREFYFKEA